VVAEASDFESPPPTGYVAARTEPIDIGSAILTIHARTPGPPAAVGGR